MKSQFLASIVLAVLAGGGLQGQAPPPNAVPPAPSPAGPVPLKRVAPTKKPAPNEPVPTPDKYPFTDLINALESDDPAVSAIHPAASKGITTTGSQNELGVPKNYKPGKDVPLTGAAKDAVQVSQTWMLAAHTPVEGKDGRVLYTYGAGLPTVVCAPLRVCVLELQPGEKLVGEPHIGDSVRWIISPATAGKDEFAVPMIVIKPKAPGLDTDLLVTTDRRAYYIRLISKPEDYLARVAFAYPDDEDAKWKAYLAREQEQRRREEFQASQIAPVESMENLYFNYTIQGGDANMRPVRVVDDGKKTYIQMPPEAAHRELPMLAVLGPDGKAELVNYRVKADMYIVDRIFDRGALILGVGKKAQRAEITRGSSRGKKLKGDPYAKVVPEHESAPEPIPAPSVTSGGANDNKPRQEKQQ
jgi:type IV secretion system protein VirB9